MKPTLVVATLVAAGGVALLAGSAVAQQQSKAQQLCINKMNKDGVVYASKQGKEQVQCLKDAATQSLGMMTGEACLTADRKGRVAKRATKTTDDETSFCGQAPNFAYTSAANVNTVAQQQEVNLVHDVFGSPLDPNVKLCDPNKPECLCQFKVYSKIEKLAFTLGRDFVKCKKDQLAALVTSSSAIEDCLTNAALVGSVANDPKGKIADRVANLQTTITLQCDNPGVTLGSFPGRCNGLTESGLGNCLYARVKCRMCLMYNAMDGLSVDCDAFDDDDTSNASCP
jgi:hypothetical protein